MGKEKDILFLCQFFYPEYISSATLPFDTASALAKAGYKVGVLCGFPREYLKEKSVSKKETVNEIDIQRVKYLQMSRKSFLGRIVNYFSLTAAMLFHIFKLKKYKSVIVYSNPPILPLIAYFAKLIFKIKLVFVAYDIYPEIAVKSDILHEDSIICKVMNSINKRVYPKADAVITLSDEMRNFIISNRKIEDGKVRVIPNWYKNNEISIASNECNMFTDITKGRFVVSYFGNMGTAQDMETVFDTIRILKNNNEICFLFAGHGNKVEKLKTIVKQENIRNVYIYEFLQGKNFQDALQISDCAIVSLKKGLTGLCVPSKTYSYMMYGIPLAAIMDECDITGDIEEGAGCWIRNGEADKLANTILKMSSDNDLCAKMRTECRKLYLQKYTTEICTQKYVDLFDSII